MTPPRTALSAAAALVGVALLAAGCAGTPRPLPNGFTAERDAGRAEAAPPEVLRAFEGALTQEYQLGPGDVVELVAPAYPELAGEQTVSPEGNVTVYPVGEVPVAGLSRNAAEARLKEALAKYFSPVAVTLRVKSFENNQVLVLGKVTIPGAVKFKGRPNLLEALARAGAFPSAGQERRFSYCNIIRGKEQLVRVFLDELLKGGAVGHNVDLANNDVVYIPENEENNVYVMGQVAKPGAYEIRTSMSLLNVIMLAGGPTEDAVTGEIELARDLGRAGTPVKVSLDRMADSSDFAGNVLLARNDIVYVPRRGIATFNYYLRMINPFTQLVFFGSSMVGPGSKTTK